MTAGASADATISVLVPITRPASHVLDLHRELSKQLDEMKLPHEILYLLGNSSFVASEQLDALRSEHADVRVIEFARGGEAAMLTAGAETSRGEVILTVPGWEFEVDVAALPMLYAAVREGADVAFAMRMRGPNNRSARLQSQLFNRLVSWVAGTRFRDVTCGTRAIRRQVFDQIPLYGDFHRYLPVIADRLGFRVRELPAPQHPRAPTRLVHPPLMYLWRAIDVLSVLFICRFTRTPLRLFGGVGAAFALVGVAILTAIGVERWFGTPMANRPVLVLATLLIGLGVQSFTIGLLGELLLFINARGIRDYRIAGVFGVPLPSFEQREAPIAPVPTPAELPAREGPLSPPSDRPARLAQRS